MRNQVERPQHGERRRRRSSSGHRCRSTSRYELVLRADREPDVEQATAHLERSRDLRLCTENGCRWMK